MNPTIDKITGKLSDQSLLFRSTIKLVLLVSFAELILYRLVSRLGMHLSKLAQEHEWIVPTFTALTQIGQWLLNVVAIYGSEPDRDSLCRAPLAPYGRIFVGPACLPGVGDL
jgi:hypothetical protein